MKLNVSSFLSYITIGLYVVAAEDTYENAAASLVGTWSSKANTVFTGPGFFDPVDELLIEPALPGISYSFTDDGYWEEAIYQITSDPKNHSCAAAVLIYQHGTYEQLSNGSLILTPYEIDGRQLLSEPCSDDGVSSYTRYIQSETFAGYEVLIDAYHGRWRLNLIKANGEYMQPLYLAYRPPQMLPTVTLNPTADAANPTAKVKRDGSLNLNLGQRVRRSLENRSKTNAVKKDGFDYSFWWYSSIGMMVLGGAMFFSSV